MADGSAGLLILDLSQPDSPASVGALDTTGDARGIAVAGDLVFVADGAEGLSIINAAVPESPVPAGAVDTPGTAWDVAVGAPPGIAGGQARNGAAGRPSTGSSDL